MRDIENRNRKWKSQKVEKKYQKIFTKNMFEQNLQTKFQRCHKFQFGSYEGHLVGRVGGESWQNHKNDF